MLRSDRFRVVNSFTSRLQATVCACTLVMGVGVSSADVEFMDTTIEMDEWTFMPAADEDAERVEAFLAVKTGGELIGDNIAVVLYVRLADDSWERLAWDDQSDASSVASAAKAAAPDIDDPTVLSLLESAGIVLDSESDIDGLSHTAGEAFGKGVFLSDPVHEMVASDPNAEELVNLLVNTGYPAANVDIHVAELGVEQEKVKVEVVLDSLKRELEHGLKFPASSVQDRLNAGAVTSAGVTWCWPKTTYSNKATGPWSCGAWQVVGTSPQPVSPHAYNVHYERTVTRTITRDCTRVCWDCTATSITQTRTESGLQKGTCDVRTANGNPPTLNQVPDEPCSPVTTIYTCAPTESTSTTAWTPGRPPC